MSKKQRKTNFIHQGKGQEKSAQPLRKQRSTKTVHILINNLDQQIKDSYHKLKLYRQRNNNTRLQTSANQTSLMQGHSSTFDRSSHKRTVSNKQLSFESPFGKKYTHQESLSHQLLLDNHQLMQYIHLVYQTYAISNPLEQEREYTTGKKTVQTRKEVGSASTMKKSFVYQDKQITPFGQQQESGRIERSGKEKKIKLTSSRVNHQLAHNIEESGKGIPKIKLRREDSSNSHHQQRNKTQIEQVASEVPQVFRFCFMCEQPILENNLQWHQKSCLSLRQAIAHKNLAQLIEILDEKIRKFRKQININLINKSEERLKEEFNNIRSSVKSWMQVLPQQQLTSHKRNFSSFSNYSSYRQSFSLIEEAIGSSSWSSYEAIRKLQWFSRLRQSIALRYFFQ